jgi:hypothetical protein
MSLDDLADVSITSETAGVRQAGFGVPGILSVNATSAARVTFYEKADDLLTDGFTATMPEYLAAGAMLAQENKPEQFAILRCANKPTQRYKLSLAVAPVAGTIYEFRVGADDITVTAGVGTFADNDYVIGQFATAITTAAPTGFTATVAGTVGAKYAYLTADTAGNYIGVESYDVGKVLVEQDHADPGVATDLAAIAAEDSTWYGLCNPFNSKAMATAIAAWTESNTKMFVAASSDSAIVTSVLAGATDLAANLQTASYARTAVLYHPATDQFADAAWLGECLPLAPGSETWKFKTLVGVDAVNLTPTQIANADNKACNVYRNRGGINMTCGTPGGTVAAGEFIDTVRGRDWLQARIAEREATLLANAKKIPFTDPGIAMVEAELRGQLQEGIDVGLLAADPAPVVTVPKAADVSAANKAARLLTGVEFSATLAGAIHKMVIRGTLTL